MQNSNYFSMCSDWEGVQSFITTNGKGKVEGWGEGGGGCQGKFL